MADGHRTAPSDLVGQLAIDLLRRAGYVVVPVDPPDYAVGEVMIGTGCPCPDRAWDALNCALNSMGIERPANADTLSRLGAGELSLEAWRVRVLANGGGREG